MEWYDIKTDGRHSIKFSELLSSPQQGPSPSQPAAEESFTKQSIGGIIKQGEWAWLSGQCSLQIVSLRNGQVISTYDFSETRGYSDNCGIICVEEVFPNSADSLILAVVLERFCGPGAASSYVALYSVELSTVLTTIALPCHASCARFVDTLTCRQTLLQNFDGCLAVGSEEGAIVLIDLNICRLLSAKEELLEEDTFVQCRIVDYNLPFTEIHRNFRQCQEEGIHFGIQVEVIDSPCPVRCMLPIHLIMGLAVGLDDGRLVLYDLTEFQIFHVTIAPPELVMAPLVKMAFIEPLDDPRPCCYVWSLHEGGEALSAVLHTLMYQKRLLDEEGVSFFETFQNSSIRLQLPLEATRSVALSCQAIATATAHGEDDSNCLCALSWYSLLEEKNKLLIFDLNQWYKEEMPFMLEYQKQPSYLAGYVLSSRRAGLHAFLNPKTIAHFNSMQRYEEHFYPNSLSFDCALLHEDGCRRYNWEGAQNKLINLLRASNAAIFLDPHVYFHEIIRTRLTPQFLEFNINSTISTDLKYEVILSTALENNCFSLLRDCARSWADGSFMSNNVTTSTGPSLSTLTEWIWKRATDIKRRCNELCKGLFECGGYPLDQREQKELGFITRQLKLLADLLSEVLAVAKHNIPEEVYSSLEVKFNSLRTASNYQDLLLWLINIGLLPEASSYTTTVDANVELVPYPYAQLKEIYAEKRKYFGQISNSLISKKSGSCRLLYIDAFIEHECKSSVLRDYWLENNGDGLYPPTSIESMLRVMLVPELSYENKCAILLYFFLDLNMAIDEKTYKGVVANFIKFPSVFKLPAPLIKTVQSFWNLDHGQFLLAVDEFISPFNTNQNYPQWLLELLIEALLVQRAQNLALRILEVRSALISPMLRLKTLLANDLISEGFHFARSQNDDSLLEVFFTCCLRNGKFGVIRDLALSEKEGQLVQNILKRSRVQCAESLHFVYLLQKSKYIEAVSYMDELSKTRCVRSGLINAANMDTPNLMLSAFNTTMAPVTQGLTDVYFRIKNKIKKKEADNKSPVPLSCQLIKQNANNLLGGIYHSSALSAHFATYYWGEMDEEKSDVGNNLLSSNNAPFLRRPQMETSYLDFVAKNSISYPQTYKISEKRSLESELETSKDVGDEGEREGVEQNPKKRRRLVGQEIVDDLSRFMQTNKNASRLNLTEFSFGDNDAEKSSREAAMADVVLTQPLTKSTRHQEEFNMNYSQYLPKGRTPVELQSILKTNTSDSVTPRRPIAEQEKSEEKSLRFRLPSTEMDRSTPQPLEGSLEEKEPESVAENSDDESISNVRHKQITRAVSVESNTSAVSSSEPSEDNYFSPLSSQNNSLVVSHDTQNDSVAVSKDRGFLRGPQPRKPLARLSAERSEKSLTPEPPGQVQTQAGSSGTTLLPYITASETLPQTTRDNGMRSSSDLGSIAVQSAGQYVSQPTISISSVDSKMNEFTPKGSSSKFDTAASLLKQSMDSRQDQVKISEYSTVVGSLTGMESTDGSNKNFTSSSGPLEKATDDLTEEQRRQMLDTTLGMSTYDVTALDSTTLPSLVKDTTLSNTNKQNIDDGMEKENVETGEEMDINESVTHNEITIEVEKCTEEVIPDGLAKIVDDECVLLSPSPSFPNESKPVNRDVADEVDNEGDSCDGGNVNYSDSSDEDSDNDEEADVMDVEEESEDDEESDATSEYDDDDDVVELIEDSSSNTLDKRQELLVTDDDDDDDVEVVGEYSVLNEDSRELGEGQYGIVQNKAEPSQKEQNEDVAIVEMEGPGHVQTDEPIIQPSLTTVIEVKDENLVEIGGVEGANDDVMISEEAKGSKEVETALVNVSSLDVMEAIDSKSKQEKINETPTIAIVSTSTITIVSTSTNKIVSEQPIDEDQENPDEEVQTIKNIEENVLLETKSRTENTSEEGNASSSDLELTNKQPAKSEGSLNVDPAKADKEETNTVPTEDTERKATEATEATDDNQKSVLSTLEVQPRRRLRETSVPRPIEPEVNVASTSSPRRSTRGISVPPQTLVESEEFLVQSPRPRRNLRATSLQPKCKFDEYPDDTATPDKPTKLQQDAVAVVSNETPESGSSALNTRTRGTSVPPAGTTAKIARRRHSVILDSNSENSAVLDSPSARTRSRMRLNSMDSELDSSLVGSSQVQQKRTRRPSLSSSVSEHPQTPKRTRRNSAVSQDDVASSVTPRSQGGRSVVSVAEEDVDGTATTTGKTRRKRTMMERKKSTDDADSVVSGGVGRRYDVSRKPSSPSSEGSLAESAAYSSSRRLTRSQLALLEKAGFPKEPIIPAPSNKRRTRRPTVSGHQDSDDAESVSSRISNMSSSTTSKRRVTRQSVKDKEETDDDLVSVVSSVGSEKQYKRRSKDKSSPNTTLTAIPEEAAEEMDEPKKRGRSAKQ